MTRNEPGVSKGSIADRFDQYAKSPTANQLKELIAKEINIYADIYGMDIQPMM